MEELMFKNIKTAEELVEIERLNTIPQVVSMRQARLALLSIGKLATVEEAITDPAARIEWDYAATVKREHMLIAAIQPLLGMSDTEVDELFVMAAGL
jgi:hypothetical protein